MSKPNILVLGSLKAQKIISDTGYNAININNTEENIAAIVIEIKLVNFDKSIEIYSEAKKALNTKSSLYFAYINSDTDTKITRKLNKIGFSVVFYNSTPKKYIEARLESAIRIAVMNKQCKLRLKALEKFGASFQHSFKPVLKANKVLLFADEAPINLKISNILDDFGARIIATSSSFMAFDFLHYSNFDAVIIAGNKDINKAYGFCSALRRNTKYFHIPCLIINKLAAHQIEELLNRGASDCAQIDEDIEYAVARLLTLIEENGQRNILSENFKNAKSLSANDEITSLYNAEFFKHFLDIASETSGIIVKLQITPKIDTEKLLIQIGYIISKLIRTEDCAAYLGNYEFAFYFANTNREEALMATSRINAVVSATCIDEHEPHESLVEIKTIILDCENGLKSGTLN